MAGTWAEGRFPPEWSPGESSRPDDRPRSYGPSGWLQQRLLDQRIVMVRGHLDSETVTSLNAELLTLEAMGTAPVRLHIDAPDGDLAAVLPAMDTIDLMVAPVHVVVTGELGGAALGVLAAAGQRRAYPHARLRLAETRTQLQGSANELLTQTSRQLQLFEMLVTRLAESTGRARHEIESDMSTGRYLTPAEAVEYGLLDTDSP